MGGVSSNRPNNLLRTNVYKALESCWQSLLTILLWTNTISVIFKLGKLSPFSSLCALLLVLPGNLILLGVESCRWYPVWILNVILFSILFTYIFVGGFSSTVSCFLIKYSK